VAVLGLAQTRYRKAFGPSGDATSFIGGSAWIAHDRLSHNHSITHSCGKNVMEVVNMTNNKSMNQSPSKGATGPRMLPVVRIDGELYFVDHRLRELRNVQNPFERLPISMASGLPYLDIKPEDLPRPNIHGGDPPSFSPG
jgi:hypothetical protein